MNRILNRNVYSRWYFVFSWVFLSFNLDLKNHVQREFLLNIITSQLRIESGVTIFFTWNIKIYCWKKIVMIYHFCWVKTKHTHTHTHTYIYIYIHIYIYIYLYIYIYDLSLKPSWISNIQCAVHRIVCFGLVYSISTFVHLMPNPFL